MMVGNTTSQEAAVPATALKKRRRWWPWIVALLAVGVLAQSLFTHGTAEERVTALCAQIRTGMPVAEMAAFARGNGLGLGAPGEGLNYLPDKASMGRHLCRVQVKGGLVESSAYLFLD